jgi:hypothetical protein
MTNQDRNGLERTDIRAIRGGDDGSARADEANAVAAREEGRDLFFEKEKFKTCTLTLGIFARATCAM